MKSIFIIFFILILSTSIQNTVVYSQEQNNNPIITAAQLLNQPFNNNTEENELRNNQIQMMEDATKLQLKLVDLLGQCNPKIDFDDYISDDCLVFLNSLNEKLKQLFKENIAEIENILYGIVG